MIPKTSTPKSRYPSAKRVKYERIDEPTVIYIPRGLVHGPVKFKKIGKPIALLSCFLAPEYSVKWEASDESKYLVNLNKQVPFLGAPAKPDDPPDVQAIHPPSTPFRYIRSAFWQRSELYAVVWKTLVFPPRQAGAME